MTEGNSTEISISEAIAAAQQLASGSAGWNGQWASAQGAIAGAESAFGNDQLGSQLRQGYQQAADQMKPTAAQLGQGWATLADGATQAVNAVQEQDAANARSLSQ